MPLDPHRQALHQSLADCSQAVWSLGSAPRQDGDLVPPLQRVGALDNAARRDRSLQPELQQTPICPWRRTRTVAVLLSSAHAHSIEWHLRASQHG